MFIPRTDYVCTVPLECLCQLMVIYCDMQYCDDRILGKRLPFPQQPHIIRMPEKREKPSYYSNRVQSVEAVGEREDVLLRDQGADTLVALSAK